MPSLTSKFTLDQIRQKGTWKKINDHLRIVKLKIKCILNLRTFFECLLVVVFQIKNTKKNILFTKERAFLYKEKISTHYFFNFFFSSSFINLKKKKKVYKIYKWNSCNGSCIDLILMFSIWENDNFLKTPIFANCKHIIFNKTMGIW